MEDNKAIRVILAMAAGLQVILIGKTVRGVKARSVPMAAIIAPILSKPTRTPIIIRQTINLAFILISVSFYERIERFRVILFLLLILSLRSG